MTIQRVGVLSVGKVLGCLYALIGLLIGGFFSLFSLLGAALAQQADQALPGLIFGVGAIVAAPLFYGAMGFIGGIISAALYNLVAAIAGGIEIELGRESQEAY